MLKLLKTRDVEKLRSALFIYFFRDLVEVPKKIEVFRDRKVRIKTLLLGHISHSRASIGKTSRLSGRFERNGAFVRPQQTNDSSKERCFSRALGTDQSVQCPRNK